MKQEFAKSQIIELWNDREVNSRTRGDVLAFYFHLKKNNPELLNFRYNGDKYQKIMGWLSRYIVE